MPVPISNIAPVRSHDWRHFFLLLGMFFISSFLAGFIPTPGAWSDVRSQWLDTAVIAILSVVFLIATVRTYSSDGPLTGLQISLLCSIFGVAVIFMALQF